MEGGFRVGSVSTSTHAHAHTHSHTHRAADAESEAEAEAETETEAESRAVGSEKKKVAKVDQHRGGDHAEPPEAPTTAKDC